MMNQTNKYFWVQTSPQSRRPAQLISGMKEPYSLNKQRYVTVRYLDALEEKRYECVSIDLIEPMTLAEEAIYMQ